MKDFWAEKTLKQTTSNKKNSLFNLGFVEFSVDFENLQQKLKAKFFKTRNKKRYSAS